MSCISRKMLFRILQESYKIHTESVKPKKQVDFSPSPCYFDVGGIAYDTYDTYERAPKSRQGGVASFAEID